MRKQIKLDILLKLQGRQAEGHSRVSLLRHRGRAQEHPLRKRVAGRPLIFYCSSPDAHASLSVP